MKNSIALISLFTSLLAIEGCSTAKKVDPLPSTQPAIETTVPEEKVPSKKKKMPLKKRYSTTKKSPYEK